jgi:hypothetical protein
MSFRKYLLVPWAAISLYAVSVLFAGAAGISSYKDLLLERNKILNNIEDLETINRELEATMDSLLYDSDAISVWARELGYGEDSERFVRIVGLPSVRHREIKPGTVKTAAKPGFVHDTPLRICSFFAGLCLFLFFFARDILNGSSATRIRPASRD